MTDPTEVERARRASATYAGYMHDAEIHDEGAREALLEAADDWNREFGSDYVGDWLRARAGKVGT